MTGVGLPPHEHLGRARHVGAEPPVGPGRAVQSVPHGHVHQGVPVRVELDLVDAVAVPVVGVQDGGVALGEPPPLLGLGATRPRPQLADLRLGPAGALPAQRLQEGGVGGDVVAGRRGDLVGDLMRGRHRGLPVLAG